ncbi:MAG: restriction endonuclease subunit S [Lachnospirales bacterium]
MTPLIRFQNFNTVWSYSKLENILDIINGFAFKSNEFTEIENDYPIIRIGDIKNNICIYSFDGLYSAKFISNKFLVKYNDNIIALSGAIFGKLGIVKNVEFYIGQ